MTQLGSARFQARHSHAFLGEGHAGAEQRAWAVIWLCGIMMTLEIVGGIAFGSLALVADGLHMSTHASALLLAAVAYSYARRHVGDRRFTFGTGKLGDLAGFTSAVILAMIALFIAYEAVGRFIHPVPIRFREAIPIAVLGLAVNLTSAWLLSRGGHHHEHHGHVGDDHAVDDGASIAGQEQAIAFEEHGHHDDAHGRGHRGDWAVTSQDNNMRAAITHVAADAAVSALVILGLLLARALGWLWMDPLAGVAGALVIASWSFGLIRDTAGVLLDMNPDQALEQSIIEAIEAEGDRLTDLHLWRLGPGHLGAIVAIDSRQARDPEYYRKQLSTFRTLSHVTVEIHQAGLTSADMVI
jgi:cation diffusion facilitator family transporter